MFLSCAVPFSSMAQEEPCPAVLGRCGQEKELPFNPTSASGIIFLPKRGRLLVFLKVFSSEVWRRGLSCLLPPVWRKLYPEPRTLDFGCCHSSSVTGWKCCDRHRPRRRVVAMVARAPQDQCYHHCPELYSRAGEKSREGTA